MSQNKKSPQNEGLEFEKRLAKKYNLDEQPGSGSGPVFKLDVRGNDLLISAKWTANKSYSVTEKDLNELSEYISGPGGLGGEATAILAIEIQGKVYGLLGFDDLVGLLESEAEVFSHDKNKEKYSTAAVPSLLRNKKAPSGD